MADGGDSDGVLSDAGGALEEEAWQQRFKCRLAQLWRDLVNVMCPLPGLREVRDLISVLFMLSCCAVKREVPTCIPEGLLVCSWAQAAQSPRKGSMSESGDNPFLSDSDEPSPIRDPTAPPAGPPPPQHLTSVRTSQAVADVLGYQGPVLTRIDPSTYGATGLVVLIQAWTPGDQLARDVIWCGLDGPPQNEEADDAADRVADEINHRMSREGRDRLTEAEMDAILSALPEEGPGPAPARAATNASTTMASSSTSGRASRLGAIEGDPDHYHGRTPTTTTASARAPKAKAKAASKAQHGAGGSKRRGPPVQKHLESCDKTLVLSIESPSDCTGVVATRTCELVGILECRADIELAQHSFWHGHGHDTAVSIAESLDLQPQKMVGLYGILLYAFALQYLGQYVQHWLGRYSARDYMHQADYMVCTLHGMSYRLQSIVRSCCSTWCRHAEHLCRDLYGFIQQARSFLHIEQLKTGIPLMQGFLLQLNWAGPNSGRGLGRRSTSFTLMLLIFLICIQQSAGAVDARVDAGATPATEITEHVSVVKPSGTRRASAPLTHETPRHVKRSYLRASARALRQGGAWYKGFWRGAKWFETSAIKTQGIGRRPSFKSEPRAWHVVTWNASGLTIPTFQELETLLRRDKVDIAFIQESKWKFESTWENAEYLYVHTCGTGPLDRVSGLLTVISTKLAKASDLQFQVLHAGRLLHVRFPCGSFHADLLNCYQYAVGQDEQVYDRRHKWFIKLHKCLSGLPKRNILVMGGDFNTPCIPHKGVCGPMVTAHAATQYKDHQDLQNILRTLNLTVLNTWCRPVHGQIATFSTFGGERASQIDFLVVRSRHATREAKQAQALPDFPVAAWREGQKHYPVQTWISKLSPPWHQAGVVQQHAPRIDTETIIHDLKQQQEPAQLRALRDEVRVHITADPTKLSTVLLKAAQIHYPAKRPEVRPLSQSEELANCAKNMWALFRRMRSQPFRMSGIFQAWRCWADFQRAHALHKDRSRQRSKQRKTDILDSAQQAATEGNAYKVWQAVKKLVPKAPRKQLQLHRHGTMMTFREELDWIVEAYGRRYGEQAQVDELQMSPVHKSSRTFSIDPAALEAQLAKLNPRKAVPKGTTPSVVWKACSQIVAGPVAEAFNLVWQEDEPSVAQSWADAEVALLPKSHGRSATPEDWRPIG